MGMRISRRLPLRCAFVLLFLALALLVLVPHPSAYALHVSPDDGQISSLAAVQTTIKSVQVTGDRIVYLVDYLTESYTYLASDLLSVPIPGGAVMRLTQGLSSPQIETFRLTPAGQVVFVAREQPNGRPYLYAIAATGGPLIRLGPDYLASPPPRVGSQLVFGLAGERVIFAVDAQVFNGFELYSVAASGGAVARLSPELPPIGTNDYPIPFWVTAFAIDDGAGTHVAFNLKQGPVAAGAGLYAVLADGITAPRRLGDEVKTLDLTPDGQRVIYTTVAGEALHTIGFDGTGDTLLDTNWQLAVFPVLATPDSSQLVYPRDSSEGVTLMQVPVIGGSPTVLATQVRFAGTQSFQLTPDGAGVLYINDTNNMLMFAPLGAATPPLALAESALLGSVRFTHDGTQALFVVTSPTGLGLYTIPYPFAAGAPTRLDDPAVSAGGNLLFDGIITQDRALYSATSGEANGTYRLYSVPITGGISTLLASGYGAGQELLMVRAAAGSQVIFTTGTRFSRTYWPYLYTVPADGSAPAALIETPRMIAGVVFVPLIAR